MKAGTIFTIILYSNLLLLYNCKGFSDTSSAFISGKEHSISEELKVFYDISSLPSYRTGTISAQVSSWDTTGGNDDGFNGLYSYVKRNKDSSLVLFDLEGRGVINRIWTPTPTTDTLDFYIDDTLKPALSVCYPDLFSGKVYPFVEPLCGNQLGGFYCYVPILFSERCRITSRGRKEQFHQIQYRLYNDDASVKAFSRQIDNETRNAIDTIRMIWNKQERSVYNFYKGNVESTSGEFTLNPGSGTTIFRSGKGGRILGIEIKPSSAFEGLTRDIDIRITWDDDEEPAVYCPVSDFFGYAFGENSMESLLLGSDDEKAYCYIPMPYDKSAKVELIHRNYGNRAAKPVSFRAEIWHSSLKRNASGEGRFYSYWNSKKGVPYSYPHKFADIKGKGHYIGSILQAQGLRAGMTYFFEGDDSTSVDGKFRIHGTGSEDYFNGGWYAMMDRWDDRMSLPLHGSLGYSLPFCRTGGYRLYLSDKLSFEKSFFHSIEHGPMRNNIPVYYTSLGLYYCDTSPEKTALPGQSDHEVFIPDTLMLYPQLLKLTLFGSMDVETTWRYGTGGESYLFTPGMDSWLRMALDEIPEGKYRVLFDIVMIPAGCHFSLWQRQKQISGWIATDKKQEERIEMEVCDLNIGAKSKTLTLRFRTDGEKNSFLLNRILLIRKK